MNDIHANLPPINLPIFTIWDWLLLGLFCFFILTFSFFYFKKRKPAQLIEVEVKEKIVELPKRKSWPEELRILKKLVEEEQWKFFSHEATRILKFYFSEKLKTNMLEKTSEEILFFIKKRKNFEEIKQFFLLVDPVKFAGESGKQERAENVFKILKKLIKNAL